MKAQTFSRIERISRPITHLLSPRNIVKVHSSGRIKFLEALKDEIPSEPYVPPKTLETTLWNLKFRTPIGNAAGMFKNGECSKMIEMQGAGFYLGGTGTYFPREGNTEEDIHLPVVMLPKSEAAINKLGLNNYGDEANSRQARFIKDTLKIPVGWSVAAPEAEDLIRNGKLKNKSDITEEQMAGIRLEYLVKSMRLYGEAGVDFLEINESCPNTHSKIPEGSDLENRLKYVRQNFLNKRKRRLPVIVKLSNDTNLIHVPQVMDLLFELGYDGVNFGNTSTDYKTIKDSINVFERETYDYFTKTFGGGVSGDPLLEKSFDLVCKASEHLKSNPPKQEFHIIRTGGIRFMSNVENSLDIGASLVQWYTGYFKNFRKHSHDVYRKMFKDLE